MAKTTASRYIIGNWKMYKTIEEALDFIDRIAPKVTLGSTTVCLAVPFTAIKSLSEKAATLNVVIGAQNMNDASEGAFTGEVAARMLKDAGAKFVLLGHSERRQYFHEGNEVLNRKVKRALESGLEPIVCVGETYEEYKNDKTESVLREQISQCLSGLDPKAISSIKIAYEPVWAIGTGLAMDPKTVSEKHNSIRGYVQELFGSGSSSLQVLYGGSVNEKNAAEFLSQKGVDGLLVGSASLYPEVFAKIIELSQNSAT